MAKKAAPPADVVEQLRGAIRGREESLNQLARLAGLDGPRLSRFLRGERDLTLAGASKLCGILGLALTPVAGAAMPDVQAPAPKGKRKGKTS